VPSIRDLTEHERAILDALIRNAMSVGKKQALDQLAVARHAGQTHAPHACFDITLPDDVPRIPEIGSSPLSLNVRPRGTRKMATIELWIADGRLSSVDLSEVREPDIGGAQAWPDLSELVLH
jgi:hypothetical protein